MTNNLNFFTSLTENTNNNISNNSDRKKARNKISKTLNELFKRCSDSVSTYDLYSKMFEILNTDNKKQKKISKKEFDLIANGGKKTKDTTIKSILNFANNDKDINNVSWDEIKDEYKEYFEKTNDKTDTFEFNGKFELSNNKMDKNKKYSDEIKKLTETLKNKSQDEIDEILTEKGYTKEEIRSFENAFESTNGKKCSAKDYAKLLVLKENDISYDPNKKNNLALNIITSKLSIKNAIKLKEAGFKEKNILNILKNNQDPKKAIELKKNKVKEKYISATITNNYDVKKVLKFQKIGLDDDLMLLALDNDLSYNDAKFYKAIKADKKFTEYFIKKGYSAIKMLKFCEKNDLPITGVKILSNIEKLDKSYDLINKIYHGKRIDDSLKNWTVTVGDITVQIKTDNNIYTEQYAQQHGVPKNGVPLSDMSMQNIEDAITKMVQAGQEVPDEIYLTDLMFIDNNLKNVSGCFNQTNENAIFIDCTEDNISQGLIYHESVHMKDYKLGDGKLNYSQKKNIIVSNDLEKIEFTVDNINYSFNSKDAERIISKYALENVLEYIAGIGGMVAIGTIRQDANGNYYLYAPGFEKYDENGNCYNTFFDYEKDGELLNTMMKLYNHLTDGKFATSQIF